ncbi:penicillin-binding protein 2 [bacterium]|nr:MAG: penicillin-binding protein 2 [bacterium]
MRKKKLENFWQVSFLFVVIVFAIAILFYRLIVLQIVDHEKYFAAAKGQHSMYQEILPKRGKIFVGNKNSDDYFAVATNRKNYLFYIVPREIEDKDNFIEQVAIVVKEEAQNRESEIDGVLKKFKLNSEDEKDVTVENVLEEFEIAEDDEYEDYDLEEAKELLEGRMQDMNDPYEIVLKDVDSDFVEKINELGLSGTHFTEFDKRYYPEHEFAADVLGFVGFKSDQRIGRYGIEEFFNSELEGHAGFIDGEKDTRGRWVPTGDTEETPAEDGCDIYLTIDRNIQFRAEEALWEAVEEYGIDSGSIIVMDPRTGEILAMANWPTFDPNYYNSFSDIRAFQNESIQSVYEPGSVFKAITMSAAINEGAVTPQTKYEDKGFVAIRDRVIHNVNNKSYGTQTMIEVLEKSLNTGAMFAQQSIGEEVFLDYVKRYHFGEILNIELKGEVAGKIGTLESLPYNPVNYATASFGQGISVTSLEMISAISAIANRGDFMQPHIVSKILKNGTGFYKEENSLGRVISVETAIKISAMMVSVVKNGCGQAAAIDGYNIAGKTGTAEIAEGGVYADKSIHTFVGFAPLEDPVFSVIVELNNPKGYRFSSSTAAPTFKKIVEFMLEYYGIAPN